MATTPNTPETANQADLTQTPNTNEEILKLLRQLVGQDSSANEHGEPKPEASSDITPEEVKRLLEELLKQKSTPANDDDEIDDEDEDGEADSDLDTLNDDDEYTDDDLETVGYIVGGAALVGAGALLYHLLRKI